MARWALPELATLAGAAFAEPVVCQGYAEVSVLVGEWGGVCVWRMSDHQTRCIYKIVDITLIYRGGIRQASGERIQLPSI